MAPSGQSSSWSDVLCCRVCAKRFSFKKLPLNLPCGHTLCKNCFEKLRTSVCPLDQTIFSLTLEKLPPNIPLLSIFLETIDADVGIHPEVPEEYRQIESDLIELAAYLHPTESINGGSVWSDELSRPLQRKLITLLCYQLMEEEGRLRALKAARAIAERALVELIISHQDSSSLSSDLWSAVRARGCQFLGPAMQEEVLKLILLTLSDGTRLPRKTLVMYIVQALQDDYPQVSKTCVGHVVQLLYRASCFNVLKREGESSLLELKEEFRDYDALRREHDVQIVQMAFDAGLRISPDQWSALLYGDQQHRPYMQSITDRLQSLQAFEQQIADLKTAIEQSTEQEVLTPTIDHFKRFANFDSLLELPDWGETAAMFDSLLCIVKAYAKFMRTRSMDKSSTAAGNSRPNRCSSYKTRFCRYAGAGFSCPRGLLCTFAHSEKEIRFHMPGPMPVLADPTPHVATYSVPPAAVVATAPPPPPPPPPLMAGAARPPVVPLPTLRNDSFIEPAKPPLNSGGIMAPPPPGMPVVPVMIPAAANYPLPVPLVSVGTVVPVAAAVPGHVASVPLGMAPMYPVPYVPASTCLNDEMYAVGCSISGEGLESLQEPNNIYELRYDSSAQNGYVLKNTDLEENQLILRRQEILTHLECLQRGDFGAGDESIDEDDLQSHVSYTVAKSVLYEDKEVTSAAVLELPPVQIQTAPPTGQTLNGLVKPTAASATVRIVCPSLSRMNSTEPATVQSPCTVMPVRDVIDQPLSTPAIQRTPLPLAVEEDPSSMADQLPPVIRPLPATPSDPQSVVSNTLDKIVDVLERMNVVDKNAGAGCSAEKQQLKLELNIVSRQIQSLDDRTKQTCLLKELEEVDKKIENLAVASDASRLSNDA